MKTRTGAFAGGMRSSADTACCNKLPGQDSHAEAHNMLLVDSSLLDASDYPLHGLEEDVTLFAKRIIRLRGCLLRRFTHYEPRQRQTEMPGGFSMSVSIQTISITQFLQFGQFQKEAGAGRSITLLVYSLLLKGCKSHFPNMLA